jgi:hypothetical protein
MDLVPKTSLGTPFRTQFSFLSAECDKTGEQRAGAYRVAYPLCAAPQRWTVCKRPTRTADQDLWRRLDPPDAQQNNIKD